jgi:hypothetical protein
MYDHHRRLEKLRFETRKSLRIFLWPLVLFIMTFILYPLKSILSLLWIVTLISAFTILCRNWFIYKTFILSLSNNHIVVKHGVVRRVNLEHLLTQVTSISIEQSFLGSLCNYGRIILYISGIKQAPLDKISNPALFRNRVNLRIERSYKELRLQNTNTLRKDLIKNKKETTARVS